MSNMLEESRTISAELDEKAAKIIETEDEAAFEALKEEYSQGNSFKRLQHRIWVKKVTLSLDIDNDDTTSLLLFILGAVAGFRSLSAVTVASSFIGH